MPPPQWFVPTLLVLVAHLFVVGWIAYVRSWKRGLLAVPVCCLIFVASLIAGAMLDVMLWQIDPVPFYIVLGGGVYAAFAIMNIRTSRISEGQGHAV
jgi:hypothetical protein